MMRDELGGWRREFGVNDKPKVGLYYDDDTGDILWKMLRPRAEEDRAEPDDLTGRLSEVESFNCFSESSVE
jgi:hypothetical protein